MGAGQLLGCFQEKIDHREYEVYRRLHIILSPRLNCDKFIPVIFTVVRQRFCIFYPLNPSEDFGGTDVI